MRNATYTLFILLIFAFTAGCSDGSKSSGGSIPAAPDNLITTAIYNNQISLEWHDNSNNETGFKLEQSIDDNSSYTEIEGSLPAGTTSYINTGLNPGTTYYYRVLAFNATGNSGYSNEIPETTYTGSGHTWTLMTDVNTTSPSSTVKYMFIHHSTGSDWISTGNGNLGLQLNLNNYYVTESDYGWGPTVSPYSDAIGSHTDTGNWPYWFNINDSTVMTAVYTNTHHEDYPTNTMADPGGENEIIMFKSCFPLSEVNDSIDDEKAIYNGLLTYFAAHTNKMFVLIVPPPMQVLTTPLLTRELANWLVDTSSGWLATYNLTHNNVYVFDYYNVLTHPDNHHRVNGTVVEHIVANSSNILYYPTGDDHPSSAGHQKATAEFIPLLNVYYNNWKGL